MEIEASKTTSIGYGSRSRTEHRPILLYSSHNRLSAPDHPNREVALEPVTQGALKRLIEVRQDIPNRLHLGDKANQPNVTATIRTRQRELLTRPGQRLRPGNPRSVVGPKWSLSTPPHITFRSESA